MQGGAFARAGEDVRVARQARPVIALSWPRRLAKNSMYEYTNFMSATAYRYLVNVPDVCQGQTIVNGTRIGVHDVVGLIVNGASLEDVCRSFPDLSKAQVYECLAYYEDHRTKIDALIAEQMAGPPS